MITTTERKANKISVALIASFSNFRRIGEKI
jgi:hypothetical protein